MLILPVAPNHRSGLHNSPTARPCTQSQFVFSKAGHARSFFFDMGASWRKYQDHFEPDSTVLGSDAFTLQLLQELQLSPDDVNSLYTGNKVLELHIIHFHHILCFYTLFIFFLILTFISTSCVAFHDMDADNCGVIRLDELLAYFKIKKTLLTEKIFEDKESIYPVFLNFEQFVAFTWQFLTLSLEKVASFAFHLLDTKNSGHLSQDNVTYLIELMHNKTKEESKTVQKLVKQCGVLHSGEKLSMEEFEKFSERQRLLCDPFRRTQIAYQSKLLGRVIWKRMRLQREAAEGGQRVEDDVADALLAKYRRERRLNTGLVELEEMVKARESMMEQMMSEVEDAAATADGRDQQLETEDLTSERIILPVEGKVRKPKSASLRRTPLLIPATEAPKKKKNKKKRSFGVRKCTSYAEHDRTKRDMKRRHSSDVTASPPLVSMLKDISNVEIFKSASLDIYDDDETTTNKPNFDDNDPPDSAPRQSFSPNVNNKKQHFKDGAVLPF